MTYTAYFGYTLDYLVLDYTIKEKLKNNGFYLLGTLLQKYENDARYSTGLNTVEFESLCNALRERKIWFKI